MNWEFLTGLPESVWPAIPGRGADLVLALMFQLQYSERLAPEELAGRQQTQLDLLLRHAWDSVPFYREHWRESLDGQGPGGARLPRLPSITRSHLQQRFTDFHSQAVPSSHGAVSESRTSGSTGTPVRVLKTELDHLFWRALTLRDHIWHERDLSGKLAVIRHAVDRQAADNWGTATAGLVRTGPAVSLHVRTEISEQLDWLQAERPKYLLTYPSGAAELALAARRQGVRLEGLAEIRTLGELLPPETRELVRAEFGVPVKDVYSSDEAGYMALECPVTGRYHVQSENVVLEVVRENGEPCATGEIGRVLVTGLHSFAMPIVRYEIGDYAEMGEFGTVCACGRSLPTLNRIIGRARNALRTADGGRFFPAFGLRGQRETAKILQFQMVQKRFDLLEARLVVAAPLDAADEEVLRKLILGRVPPGFALEFSYPERLARGPGGKFEELVIELPPQSSSGPDTRTS